MADLEKTLLVHLAKASVFMETDIAFAKEEIDTAIALLTAEKPRRTRKSKND